jgi:hypothetical protein
VNVLQPKRKAAAVAAVSPAKRAQPAVICLDDDSQPEHAAAPAVPVVAAVAAPARRRIAPTLVTPTVAVSMAEAPPSVAAAVESAAKPKAASPLREPEVSLME